MSEKDSDMPFLAYTRGKKIPPASGIRAEGRRGVWIQIDVILRNLF